MSKSKCCVRGCKSSPPHFKFPTSRILVRKWLAALAPHCDMKAVDPHTAGFVCSKHFLAEEWECARGRVRLKKGIVPSLFEMSLKQETDSSNSTDDLPLVPNADYKQDNGDKKTDNILNSSEKTNQLTDTDEIQKEDSDLPKESTDSQKNNSDSQKESCDPQKESNGLKKECSDPQKDSSTPQNTSKTEVVKSDQQKVKNDPKKYKKEKSDPSKEHEQKVKLGEKEMSNGRDDSGEERVQEKASKEMEVKSKSNNNIDRKKYKDKIKESTPKLPSGPRDIDKDKVEDIEDLLTYYHIKQNNIHNTSEEVTSERTVDTHVAEQLEIEFEPMPAVDPVFIEISVDKDSSANGADKNDCLMVLESVQVEVDPSSLMLQEPGHDADMEIETLEIEEDPPNEKGDPISLLSSSDEDDVIIQEPHIDTVEVSDETDEDDMPLVKLLRKRRAEKKKNVAKKVQKKDTSISKITWGLYEYYCVQCHFKTTNGADYRKHMAAHAKVILMCQLCGYMTASTTQFAKHEKQHGDKTYKCDLCDFKTKRNISLIYHMKTHKQVSKEFKCGECDFVAFSDQAILKHLRFCNGGKKHKCDKCSYSTKKSSDLKRHKSRKHDDDEDKDEDYVPPARCKD